MKNTKTEYNQKKFITQADVLQKHHKFLRQSDSQSNSQNQQKERSARKNKSNIYQKYGQNLAKKYYSKLYKQYALVDLTRYETGQIGCRWRSQKEVIAEKGEKYCGEIHCPKKTQEVYEMNFGYLQEGIKKNALVKVSMCRKCAQKLNYKKQLKKISKQEKPKQYLQGHHTKKQQ